MAGIIAPGRPARAPVNRRLPSQPTDFGDSTIIEHRRERGAGPACIRNRAARCDRNFELRRSPSHEKAALAEASQEDADRTAARAADTARQLLERRVFSRRVATRTQDPPPDLEQGR